MGKSWVPVVAVISLVITVAVVILAASSAIQANQLADKQWADLQSRGTLRIGIDAGWYPFSYYDQQGWQGLDADLMNEIARRMHLQVQNSPVGYDSLYDSLTLWQTDAVISAVVVDPARLADYRFTTPYFDAGVRLIVRGDDLATAVDELTGKTVLAVLGTEADRVARRYERRIPQLNRMSVERNDDALPKLLNGEVDAIMLDALAALKLAADSENLRVHSVEPVNYAIALRSDNPRLLQALNTVLDEMNADGTIEHLVRKWIAK